MNPGNLPEFVWVKIFGLLDHRSKCSVALTCKNFNGIVKSHSEIYKTFKLVYTALEKLPALTRPFPEIIVSSTKLNSKNFPSILRFFEQNESFLKDLRFEYTRLNLNNLIQLMNFAINSENVYIHKINICENDERGLISKFKKIKLNCLSEVPHHPVKNQLLKLKCIKLFDIDNPKLLLTHSLNEFFKDSTQVTDLSLSNYCFNLSYNKPKLKKLYLILHCINTDDFKKCEVSLISENDELSKVLKEVKIVLCGSNSNWIKLFTIDEREIFDKEMCKENRFFDDIKKRIDEARRKNIAIHVQ